MAFVASYDNNILNLPYEIINMIFDKMTDEELITLIDIPEFISYALELLKKRLNNMTMENLARVYMFEPIRNEIQIQFNQLSDLKYKTLKNIYINSTDINIIHSIEALISDSFVEVVGQPVPEGMNFIMQVDSIRAVLITFKFMELVDNNGGLFNAFNAYNSTVVRNLTNIEIKMVNTHNNHSYTLDFAIGILSNQVRVARGNMIEGGIDYDFNSIFMRLYDSIIQKYSFDEMKINSHTIGNHTYGLLNEEFNL